MPGGCTSPGSNTETPDTSPSAGSSCHKSIEGASNGAPPGNSARNACPSHGAADTHAPQLDVVVRVHPLGLADTACGSNCSGGPSMGVSSAATSHQHPASGIKGYLIHPCACRGARHFQHKSQLLHTPPFSLHEASRGLFPWDPGGYPYILVFNKKGKPRCKRLNPILLQLSSSRTSWVSKGGGDVMGIKRGAVGRKCPSWALSPLVLISVSLSYLSIGIVPYCLGTRGVSPMYLLYSAHGAQWKASNEL